ncbi:hypothetical protein [Rheinheimera hassiensis]|uniref:hypothetical protein n=1 Tax=Rheinheimera hassiensis TaxID=1193627 RepID=UPI001F053A48|nr:hypothetical protein [Rheinheimera hassiensis]
MKAYRSASQILFGFLPDQTIDLQGKVWKVKDWIYPIVRSEIDIESVRREIIKQATPWANSKMDNGFVNHLRAKADLKVVTLNLNNGVEVEPFPKNWQCKSCKRLHDQIDFQCQCGAKGDKGQLFFVGFHDKCGTIKQPWIQKCKEHNQVRAIFPGTASATEIIFDCPVCNVLIRKGFSHASCQCGQGPLKYQPHRAASVYTSRSIVIVNPPSREHLQSVNEAGGRAKALSWVLGGMKEPTIKDVTSNKESLKQQLLSQGLPLNVVEQMLAAAGDAIGNTNSVSLSVSSDKLDEAEAQAVTIALATIESRVTIDSLIEKTSPKAALFDVYKNKYSEALQTAKLASIDLIERFPIMTGQYGYSRGGNPAGEDMLVPFKARKGGGYTVYADIAKTEALFIRLDPMSVARWLLERGFSIGPYNDDKSCRAAIIESIDIPSVFSTDDSAGSDLLTLIHSYAHRFIRIAAIHSGIDRNSLSELIVPLHLGFFVYASARGDFVLGGLQAMFESGLNQFLNAVVFDEHRCVLDPGCLDTGGACMGCLHLGEPSCRYFNLHLNRDTLFGPNGYF